MPDGANISVGGGGILSNKRVVKTANFVPANSDKGCTFACNGATGSMQVLFGAATTYDTTFACLIINEHATRGVFISFNGTYNKYLYPGQSMLVYRQDTKFQYIRPERWKIPVIKTIFVDITLGNDNNDGLATGAVGALKTSAAAIDRACADFDFNGQGMAIKFADGTYPSILMEINQNWVGAGELSFLGNLITPANVVVGVADVGIGIEIKGTKSGPVIVEGFKPRGSTGIRARDKAHVRLGNMNYAGGDYHVDAYDGAFVDFRAGYTISGGASQFHINASRGSKILQASFTVTLTGTPAFGGAFIGADFNGHITVYAVTYSGAATGPRFRAIHNGSLVANSGLIYFPGNAAGQLASGGTYDDMHAGTASMASFKAHKNNVDQAGLTNGVANKITFTSEDYDIGNYYDAANSRWTPPAGKIRLSAIVHIDGPITVSSSFTIQFLLNGVGFVEHIFPSVVNTVVLQLSADYNATGTDYFEVVVWCGFASGTGIAKGYTWQTVFTGSMI